MKSLKTVGMVAGTANVECPYKKNIRILMLECGVVSGGEGDQTTIQFSRPPDVLGDVASETMTNAINLIFAAIGAPNTQPRQAMVDPVTGVITYDQTVTTMTIALPDVTWDTSIRVIVSPQTGSPLAGTVLYEESDRTP